jgi:hypothetical protein
MHRHEHMSLAMEGRAEGGEDDMAAALAEYDALGSPTPSELGGAWDASGGEEEKERGCAPTSAPPPPAAAAVALSEVVVAPVPIPSSATPPTATAAAESSMGFSPSASAAEKGRIGVSSAAVLEASTASSFPSPPRAEPPPNPSWTEDEEGMTPAFEGEWGQRQEGQRPTHSPSFIDRVLSISAAAAAVAAADAAATGVEEEEEQQQQKEGCPSFSSLYSEAATAGAGAGAGVVSGGFEEQEEEEDGDDERALEGLAASVARLREETVQVILVCVCMWDGWVWVYALFSGVGAFGYHT